MFFLDNGPNSLYTLAFYDISSPYQLDLNISLPNDLSCQELLCRNSNKFLPYSYTNSANFC